MPPRGLQLANGLFQVGLVVGEGGRHVDRVAEGQQRDPAFRRQAFDESRGGLVQGLDFRLVVLVAGLGLHAAADVEHHHDVQTQVDRLLEELDLLDQLVVLVDADPAFFDLGGRLLVGLAQDLEADVQDADILAVAHLEVGLDGVVFQMGE